MRNTDIVIVDDHTLLSQAIQDMINSFENFNVLYTCKNGQELINRLNTPKNYPKIILMDVNMPIMNGIETTEWLTKNHPEIFVLALSVEDEEKTILSMLKAGAKGYLLKDTERNILELALIETAKTGYYYTKHINKILLNSFNDKEKTITLKEKEIIFLELICTEMTYKEIAQKMFLSPKTIDGYRDKLFSKLRVKNRIGLAMYAVKNNIFIP